MGGAFGFGLERCRPPAGRPPDSRSGQRHLPFDSEEETNQLEGRLSMAFPPVIMGS